MRTSIRSFLLFSVVSVPLAASVAGCGVRTALNVGDTGVPHGFDGGTADMGVRDATVPPDTNWDGGECTSSAQCDDDLFCNGMELCNAGHCVRGAPVACADAIPCTIDQCVEGGGCVSRPDDSLCPPGNTCNPMVGCVPTTMRCMSDFECDDHLACDGIERCDVTTGTCRAGMPMNCSDGVSCTDDSCVEGFGCAHSANSGECGINQICDPMAGCVTRTCSSTGACDDGDPCNGTEFCSTDGLCHPGSPLRCDDGNTCTIDFCVTGVGCQSSRQPEICGDGADNDCNGLADCMDPACFGPMCMMMCIPTAPFEQFCDDGRDDDCDGRFDCADPECIGRPACLTDGGTCMRSAPFEIICNNGIDEDCDGTTDCADPECFGNALCGPGDAGVCVFPEICHNGVDEDCNGLIDCADPFCFMTDPSCAPCMPVSPFERRCSDGRDDDCDMLLDCADPDCNGRSVCADAGPPTFDAGHDAAIVPVDTGPPPPRDSGVTPTHELGIAMCTNGIDDDRDGRTDCADPDCSPFGPMGECCNGLDDNADGNIDEFTCRCFDNSFCPSVGSLDQICWLSSYSVCAPRCNFYGGNAFCTMYLPATPTCNVMTGECM